MKAFRIVVCILIAVAVCTFSVIEVGRAQTYPDLSIWVDHWFKVKLSKTVYHFEDIGVKPTTGYPLTPLPNPAYLKITGWDPDEHFLTANVYTKDHTGNWNPAEYTAIQINYFAGSQLKFVGSCLISSPGLQIGFSIYFKGKRDLSGDFILGGETFLATMGGYFFEMDDDPESTERWAGSASITGNMIPLSKVPPALLGT